jgi:hypothetical protein
MVCHTANLVRNLDTVTWDPRLQDAPIYRRDLFEPRTQVI